MRRNSLTPRKYYNCQRGSVLVLVLIVISAMTIIAFGLAYQTRIEIRLSKSSSQQAKVWHMAISGIEACKAILSEKELTAEQTAKVCMFYSTKDNIKSFDHIKIPIEQDTQLVFWIKDENSFLDLNKSNSACWENLPFFSRDKRACILDWIDTDSDTNPDGAERDYYEGLEPPYGCKNAQLIYLKELLFVKNIERNDYLDSVFKNEIANPDDIEMLLNEKSTKQLPLIETFTVYGQEKVNINTVPGEILSVLPGFDQQAADVVITFRAGPDGLENSDNDRFFEKAEDILLIEGLTELQKELLNQYCCFNSNVFRVFSYAKADKQVCFIMATIRIEENKPEILSVERLL